MQRQRKVQRRFGAQERAALAAQIALAQTLAAPRPPAQHDTDADRAALGALWRWYRDWSTTAKAVIRRKDRRISLGLSRRGS